VSFSEKEISPEWEEAARRRAFFCINRFFQLAKGRKKRRVTFGKYTLSLPFAIKSLYCQKKAVKFDCPEGAQIRRFFCCSAAQSKKKVPSRNWQPLTLAGNVYKSSLTPAAAASVTAACNLRGA